MKKEVHRFIASKDEDGLRLDVAVARMLRTISRSKVQKLIEKGCVFVGGLRMPQGFRLREGMEVVIEISEDEEKTLPFAPMPFSCEVLYEDDYIMAINKFAGLVVHPGAGHMSGTLVNMLIASGRKLSALYGDERAGLVHRLDKGTSGVIVVAKDEMAHERLERAFQHREVLKFYLAIVLGAQVKDEWIVESFYDRRKSDRKQFTSRAKQGREARTLFFGVARANLCALVLAKPITGRTHQIRVHLAENGHPVLGDRVYGRGYPALSSRPKEELEALLKIKRQALHAYCLRFLHPITREIVTLKASLPDDMSNVCRSVFGESFLDQVDFELRRILERQK
jgi:23S rRNA pseudouridine1911/1915/1917 synthase